MRARSVQLLVPLMLFVSCVPLPHRLHDLPAIKGTVVSNGIPVAGVRVHVSDVTRANPCQRGEQVADTGDVGAFTTPGRRRLALFAPLLPFHGLDTWAVALFRDGLPLGYVRPWNYRAGPRHSPRDVDLSCDLLLESCLVHDRSWGYQRTLALVPCARFSPDGFSEVRNAAPAK